MNYQRLVSWVITRGIVSGAVLGALLGAFIMFIYGAIIGFVAGAIIGAALGFINGILLTTITMRWYAPPRTRSFFPNVIYIVAILTNTLPFFAVGALSVNWSVMPFTFKHLIRGMIFVSGLPALLSGIAAAYFSGGFLEYADLLIAQIPSRNSPANVLS